MQSNCLCCWLDRTEVGDEKTALLFLYLHMIEMLDAITARASEASGRPARMQVRSIFEALLGIEYIVERQGEHRARAFLVSDVRRGIASLQMFDPTTPEGKRFAARKAKVSFMHDAPIAEPPDRTTRIASLKSALAMPNWKPVDDEIENAKVKGKKRWVEWYQLTGDKKKPMDGPENLSRLAEHLKRPDQYELLYRIWSGTTHAVDAFGGHIGKSPDGESIVRSFRDPKDLAEIVAFAILFMARATDILKKRLRPGEENSYVRWYHESVLPQLIRLMEAGGVKPA